MKILFHASTALAGFVMAAGLLPAASFQVPFEFEASGRLMPAGAYEVSRISPSSPVLRLRSRETGKAFMVSMPLAMNDHQGEKPRMVFRCHNGGCSVVEFWAEANTGVARIPQPNRAKPVVFDTGL
jgi:hypothetical protein